MKDNPNSVQAYHIIQQFLNKGCGYQSLVLCGPARVGKTRLAKALLDTCSQHYRNFFPQETFSPSYLFLTDSDGLNKYDSNIHKFLLFDDVCLQKFSHADRLKYLATGEDSQSLRRRHYITDIQPYTPRIFTTNTLRSLMPQYTAESLARIIIVFIDTRFDFHMPYNPEKAYYLSSQDINLFPHSSHFLASSIFHSLHNNNQNIHQNTNKNDTIVTMIILLPTETIL